MSLICEIDHLDYLDFLRGIPDESVDLVITDPPYGIGWRCHRRKKKLDILTSDDKDFSYMGLARECFRILKSHSAAFFFTGWRVYPYHFIQVKKAGFRMREPLICQKQVGMGNKKGSFVPNTEWAIFAHKGQHEFRETTLAKTRGLYDDRTGRVAGRWKTSFPSAWFGTEYPSATEHNTYRKKHNLTQHPTVKSHKLISWLIQLCSDPGALVVDPFVGSGTTAVAAQMTGQNFIGCDIDGKFVKMARRRVSHQGFFK